MMQWRSSEYTDVGLKRSINEDALLSHTAQGLWVVADGMGGHDAGDYASQHVVEALGHFKTNIKPGVSMARLTDILMASNRHLVELAKAENLGTVGCTMAALTIARDQIICSWCGDSRIYRLRSGKLRQLTRDHNYGATTEDRNRMQYPTASGEDSELLTAAIGGDTLLHLEHCWFALQQADQYLLCTDGLYKELQDTEIESMLNAKTDPDSRLGELAALYRERGARDNVGMVYVYAAH